MPERPHRTRMKNPKEIWISVDQMQDAMRQLGFRMVGVKPNSGFDRVTVWEHPARPKLEFTVSDADIERKNAVFYSYAVAYEIVNRAHMFRISMPDRDGFPLEIETDTQDAKPG